MGPTARLETKQRRCGAKNQPSDAGERRVADASCSACGTEHHACGFSNGTQRAGWPFCGSSNPYENSPDRRVVLLHAALYGLEFGRVVYKVLNLHHVPLDVKGVPQLIGRLDEVRVIHLVRPAEEQRRIVLDLGQRRRKGPPLLHFPDNLVLTLHIDPPLYCSFAVLERVRVEPGHTGAAPACDVEPDDDMLSVREHVANLRLGVDKLLLARPVVGGGRRRLGQFELVLLELLTAARGISGRPARAGETTWHEVAARRLWALSLPHSTWEERGERDVGYDGVRWRKGGGGGRVWLGVEKQGARRGRGGQNAGVAQARTHSRHHNTPPRAHRRSHPAP